MLSQLKPAIVVFTTMTLITGAAYPLAVTGVAKVAFPRQAGGSIVTEGGRAAGSELIAQPFTEAKYFWPRPSAANYDGAAGAGSNLGPSNPALAEAVKQRVEALRPMDPGNDRPVPVDLVTASGSGLDPHISLAAARFQLRRVARARGLSEEIVSTLLERETNVRTMGVLGEPTVNVLLLNLALDHPDLASRHRRALPDMNVTRWPMTTH